MSVEIEVFDSRQDEKSGLLEIVDYAYQAITGLGDMIQSAIPNAEAVMAFAKNYPQLMFGDPMRPGLDMFNHGAMDGVWFGEDYAFSKRWNDIGGEIWLIPDLNIDHWRGDTCYKGNFHEHLINYSLDQQEKANAQT